MRLAAGARMVVLRWDWDCGASWMVERIAMTKKGYEWVGLWW